MDEKLKILLEQLSLDENDYKCFEDGCIEKIICDKEKNNYQFIIKINQFLPVDVYDNFIKYLPKRFPTINNIKVRFIVSNNGQEYVNDYFLYAIDKYSKEFPLLLSFKDATLIYENDILTIEVANKAEEIKLSSIKKQLFEDFKNFGFENIKIKIKINNEKAQKIKEEIELMINEDIKKVNGLVKPNVANKIIIGQEIKGKTMSIHNIIAEADNVIVEGHIFNIDYFESNKSNFKIITLKITDYTNSIYCKIFTKDDDQYNQLKSKIKIGKWYKIRGYSKNDIYSKELVLNARDINVLDKEDDTSVDNAPIKRVELHAHTFMSQMDGLINPIELVKYAKSLGHKAVAVTDHNSVQSFPDIYKEMKGINKNLKEGEEPFKVLFGAELTMINDQINITINPTDSSLLDTTYVIVDFETTGLNAGGGDSIIEVGAVKLLNGEIIDRFSELIDPGVPLVPKITEITNITDEMLKGKPSEEEVIKRFIEWFGDFPLVAHNAKFDLSFLEMAYSKYNLGTFSNTVIDTLELSRTLDTTFSRHSLSALVKRYNVVFDEDSHHRADYDAEATAMVFQKMLKKLSDQNFATIIDLDKLVSKDEIHKFGTSYHINILAKNKVGLKNLFQIISLANTKYLYKTPRILRSEIEKLREGLLIGSGCYQSEVFLEARSKNDEELTDVIKFYDYVEVQPIECYDHLLQGGDFPGMNDLIEHIKKIIRLSKEAGTLIVATGDVHHLRVDDKIYREIIVNQKVPGGGRHPLTRKNITTIPSNHFRTTEEMLEDFSFLDKEIALEIVVNNTNKIADMIEIFEVILDTKGVPFSPKIENSAEEVKEMVYKTANNIYGEELPQIIKERIENELQGIIKGGFDVIYLISQKLVKKSNDDGYLVGSRGSVGSSFVATMLGITEVNPLPAHYVCPKCCHSIFEQDGVALGSKYSSGYDLPAKNCPKCNHDMTREGQDMPFATFLGFDANKVPDIDLNFSGVYQWKAHEYTKELFGIDNVYRAGTIGTVADKTAFGYVKGYCEDKGIIMRNAEIERLAKGCTGVKRTTGQHPGGIVVIPDYKDVYDFTPYQYPADDSNSLWRTTHFDYHAIDECLLKLDILGHDDPTMLKMLQDLSEIDVTSINLSDPLVMKIFSSPEVLGVTPEQILCETGTLGVPEFGTKFVIGMLMDTKPKTFGELLKISGLSHGTDVWLGNAQELIKNNVCEFKDVIGCRDDIMVYLSYNGLKPKDAFKIMEFVRKGRPTKEPEAWKEYETTMKEAGIVDWYIESCRKIKYMFPKAHAAAYVMSALRIAWFKVHYPKYYYTAYFSVRCHDFYIESMIKGYDAIKRDIEEIIDKGYDATNKELAVLEVLQVALEATARGFKFANIDIEKSDANNFILLDDYTLLPPFRTIDGLGELVAKKVVEERSKQPFLSIENLQKRGKVTATTIEKMRIMGVLDKLDESNQLSLF
ncbi:MAG: PolC-type DNA polymerase III [Bacilli bacterium]|nr:PolC-type DNA polymerase III [Bacilli bacterium]MDD4282423.1 PolC-type DNA polymerase III [Bacilli bacterium]MDD4718457.1 PolC-type DNA polymerase III [Bacilli bacterium]